MSALSPILRTLDGGLLAFWCPGCDGAHAVRVRSETTQRPSWEWNKSVDKPSFTPSILVRGTRMTDKGMADYQKWRNDGYPPLSGKSFDSCEHVCHSFVTDGQIQFLSDCTHYLAGQTVPLPEFQL